MNLLSRRALMAAAIEPRPIRLALDTASAQIRITSGDRFHTAFHFGERWPKPFLYPLLSPSGTVMTRAFPVEPKRAGESDDHAWHRGLFVGHGIINGFDFWREIKPEKTGRLVPAAPPKLRRNAFAVTLNLMPPGAAQPIGTLVQEWAFAWRPKGFVIDTRFTYNADQNQPLEFGDTDDGGFGLRLRDEFREDRGAIMKSDSGATGTKALWGKPARWIDYSADVEGKPAGVAMYDHPKNPRYPTAWHARPYALNAANPIANRSFNGKSAPSGDLVVPAGRTLTLAYRVLLHDGMGGALNLNEESPK
jgi:hypothetical protein